MKKVITVSLAINIMVPFAINAEEEPFINVYHYNIGFETITHADAALLRKAVVKHLQSCSFDCTQSWGDESHWKKGMEGRHILMRYSKPHNIKTADERKLNVKSILLPLKDEGWEFTLVKTESGYSCNTKCSPESLKDIVCNKSVRVSKKEAYKWFCQE